MSLRLHSVTRRFGAQRALDAVSIHVRAGDCYGLIGHNGAGKTTALRIALGLDRPDAGRVTVDGLDAAEHPCAARARMGGLIETPGFHGHLDARANLVLLARLQGLERAAARAEAERWLASVGLADTGRKPVQDFSQGMRQRLGIAQALLGSPRYVLLDEPTNGLDPEGSAEVRALLARLVRQEGVSVLVSSHQLHELSGLCNRIGVMQRGRLVVEAETKALLASAAGRFEVETDDDGRAMRVLGEVGVRCVVRAAGGLEVELGTRSAGEVARRLIAAGIELVRLGRQEATLEEIYLWFSARGVGLEPDGPRAGLEPGGPRAALERGAPLEPDGPRGGPERGAPLEAGGPRAALGRGGSLEGGGAGGPGGGLGRVVRYEVARSVGRWTVPLVLGLPAVVAGVSVVLERRRVSGDAARVASGELASATAVTGYGALAAALQAGLPLLALVSAGLASQAIAGELARGTLRNVLLRPQTRLAVAGGKALAGAVLTLGAYVVLAAVAAILAGAAFGFGDLVELLPNGEPFPLVSAAELRPDLARALVMPAVALLGFFALGFLGGAVARGAPGALGLALGSLLALDLARAVARGLGAEPWLLTAYLPTPLGDTSFLHWFADRSRGISNSVFELGGAVLGLPRDLACPLAWAVACFALAAILLQRRAVP